jgi:hypothetical protein
VRRFSGRKPQGHERADGPEQIAHVEPADERRVNTDRTLRGRAEEADAFEGDFEILRPVVGAGAEAEGLAARAAQAESSLAPCSSSRFTTACPFGMEVPGEEELFGFEVRFEAPVEIEMIAGEIGEDRGAERRPRNRSCTRAWEEASRVAWVTPSSTISLSSACRSSDSGVVRVAFLGRPAMRVLHGAEQARDHAFVSQPGIDEKRGRGLAVRAGDRGQGELLGGLAVKDGGHVGQGGARVGGFDPGKVEGRGAIGDHRHRASPLRRFHEFEAVDLRPVERGEEVPARHRRES